MESKISSSTIHFMLAMADVNLQINLFRSSPVVRLQQLLTPFFESEIELQFGYN